MQKLKGKVYTCVEVEYDEWDRFINQQMGTTDQYEIVPIEEACNDRTIKINVTTPSSVYEGHAKQFKSIKDTGNYPMYCTHQLAEWMCQQGLLDRAVYMIRISW